MNAKLEKIGATLMQALKRKSKEEIRASLFSVEDLPRFSPFRKLCAAEEFYINQGKKYGQMGDRLEKELRAAVGQFATTLADEDHDKLLAAAHATLVFRESRARYHFGLDADLMRGLLSAPAFRAQNPNMGEAVAEILEWMTPKYQPEIERVRISETTRFASEDEALAGAGHDSNESEPVETRSPILREMIEHHAKLSQAARSYREGRTQGLILAGDFIWPIVRALEARKSAS